MAFFYGHAFTDCPSIHYIDDYNYNFFVSRCLVSLIKFVLPHERLKVVVNEKGRKCSLSPQTSFYAPS